MSRRQAGATPLPLRRSSLNSREAALARVKELAGEDEDDAKVLVHEERGQIVDEWGGADVVQAGGATIAS